MEKSIFETVVIFNTNEKDKEKIIKEKINEIEKHLQTYSLTKKVNVDYMGEKKLAYDIKKYKTGYYAIFKWQGTHENVEEIEKFFRIEDTVIKYISIKHDDDSESELEDLDISEQINQDAQESLLDIYQLLFS